MRLEPVEAEAKRTLGRGLHRATGAPSAAAPEVNGPKPGTSCHQGSIGRRIIWSLQFKHGSFEPEALAVGRGGQPTQHAFDAVPRKDAVEFPVPRLGQGEETLPHRGGDSGRLHASDST